MIDYPYIYVTRTSSNLFSYPTNFVAPVPAWPVNVFCQQMEDVITQVG